MSTTNLPLPESTWKRTGLALGGLVAAIAAVLVVLPVALLAIEAAAGTVEVVVSTVTEPRRDRRPA